MREILFRGKREDNGEWVYGYYVKVKNHYTKESSFNKVLGDYIIAENNEFISVIPETVGQYTGLDDKNGKKIFENDVVEINGWWDAYGPAGYDENKCIIKWDNSITGFEPFNNYDCDCGVFHEANDCEVIGTIFDREKENENN